MRGAIGEAEPILVDVARDCDPLALRRVAEHWKHMVDAKGYCADEEQRHQRRRLYVSSTFQGMVAGDFELEAEGGATVITAIDTYAKPFPGDARTPAQRRADALVELCRQALNRGRTGRSRRAANLGRSSSPARLRCRHQPHHHRRHERAARRRPPHPGRSGADAAGGDLARDRHCVAPGGDRPPEWCDVHHRVHWLDGGETKLTNLELPCSPHHHEQHPDDRAPP